MYLKKASHSPSSASWYYILSKHNNYRVKLYMWKYWKLRYKACMSCKYNTFVDVILCLAEVLSQKFMPGLQLTIILITSLLEFYYSSVNYVFHFKCCGKNIAECSLQLTSIACDSVCLPSQTTSTKIKQKARNSSHMWRCNWPMCGIFTW